MIKLGANILSQKVQRNLGRATGDLSTTSERLASGQRINKASDDAAGLAVASSLQSRSRLYTQAHRNLSDGISLLNVADGALDQLSSITTRISELAEQAANGTYSFQQRKALNTEARALTNEFNRIVEGTTFNGRRVLDVNDGVLVLQAGIRDSATLKLDLGTELARTTGDGTFQSAISFNAGANPANVKAGDLNGDGRADLLVHSGSGAIPFLVYTGNGDGSFTSGEVIAPGGLALDMTLGDFNGDGKTDFAASHSDGGAIEYYLGNGNGTFQARRTLAVSSAVGTYPTIHAYDVNNDGYSDLITGTGDVEVLISNGDGTFQSSVTYVVPNFQGNTVAGDFNGDGSVDLITNSDTNSVTVLINSGDGTFQVGSSYATGNGPAQMATADFNRDGFTDVAVQDYFDTNKISILLGNGNGTFQARTSVTAISHPWYLEVADFNGDGDPDIASPNFNTPGAIGVSIGNGDGSFNNFSSNPVGLIPNFVDSADFNGDGAIDLVSSDYGDSTISILLGNTREDSTILELDLTSASSARAALEESSRIHQRVIGERGAIGVMLSRVSVASAVAQHSADQETAAAARILDADLAEESARSVAARIRQQVASSLLAQANLAPQIGLKLIQNS